MEVGLHPKTNSINKNPNTQALINLFAKGRSVVACASARASEADRIPIGEVRGGGAFDLLKASGAGHFGGIATIHARAARVAPAASE